MRVKKVCLSIFIATCFIATCLSIQLHAEIESCSPDQLDQIESGLALFEDINKPVVKEMTTVKDHVKYIKKKGSLTVQADEELSVDFLFYEAKKKNKFGKTPLVIMYASLNGVSIFEKYLASSLAKEGISVVVNYFMDEQNLYVLDNHMINMMNNLLVSLSISKYFSSLPSIDSKKVSLFGVSYGGIRATYHMAADLRIKSATLMVAGAPLEEVMTYSNLDRVVDIRNKHMEGAGIENKADYLQALKDQEVFSLTDAMCRRKTEEFYLFISKHDSWVPTKYQWHLWSELGQPKHHVSSLGHQTASVWFGLSRFYDMLTFFQNSWETA